MLPTTKPDKAAAAQLLADAMERVRLAESRARDAGRVLEQSKLDLEHAMRNFRVAHETK